jgi:hypothetical protein
MQDGFLHNVGIPQGHARWRMAGELKKNTVLGHMISEWDQSEGRHYFHLLLEQEKELTPAQIA